MNESVLKIETLVATMHQKDISKFSEMNIQTDAVIINQGDAGLNVETEIGGKKLKFLSFNERGLSKSRNRAIEASTADICVIADDDLTYFDDSASKIQKAYSELKDADLIIFDVRSTNKNRPSRKFETSHFQFNFRKAMQVPSYRISFKLEAIKNNNIKFNEIFGAGSKYSHGEENIFIKECLKKKLKMFYYPETIATVSHQESTWFNGFDEKFFFDKGAIYKELFGKMAVPFLLRFLIVKRKRYKKDITFFKALKAFKKGIKEYKKYLKEKRQAE